MKSPVRLDLSLTVDITQEVDAVAYFTSLAESDDRERYRALDLVEFGCEEEFERPIAWLFHLADQGAVPASIVPGQDPTQGDVSRSEIRVVGRYGKEGCWSVDDFYDLADRVDWIAETWLARRDADPHAGPRTDRDEILARRLGSRADVPLFDPTGAGA